MLFLSKKVKKAKFNTAFQSNCTGKSKIPCAKCGKDFASSFTYLFHRCRRDPKQKERVYSSFSSHRSSIISTIISPTIPVSSLKSGSLNSSDNSEVIFLHQRVQSLELIISQLSASILELSNKIPNQVSQVGIPTYTMDSFMDPFDINTVADEPCSSANQNIV